MPQVPSSAVDAGTSLQAQASLDLPTAVPAAGRLVWGGIRARHLAVALLGGLLLACTAGTLIACFLTVFLPQQLDEGEPLIYGLAARILGEKPLYQPIDRQPFVQAHYTPLYYYAVAGLRAVGALGFTPGRLLSVAAGLVTAALVGYLTAARTRNRWSGVFGALMFLGLSFPGGPAPFLALERVDVLGVGLSIASIALLTYRTGQRWLIGAGIFAGLAVLTKQSAFAAAVAGTLWLVTLKASKAGVFAAASAATVLLPSLLLEWESGGAYWDNIGPANPTPIALAFGAQLFTELVVTQGIPALLALAYVIRVRAWKSNQVGPRLLLLYWLVSAIPVTGIIKAGSNRNYWIEFAAVNSVLATLAIWTSLRPQRRILPTIASMLPIVLLAAQLGWLAPARFITERSFDPVPLSWSLLPNPIHKLQNQAAGFSNLVRAVKPERGVILAESADVVVLGGHQVAFEPFAFSMLEAQRRWDSEPLVDDICSGRIALLILSYPIDVDVYPVGLREFPMWPNSVMAALRHSMKLADERDWHYLYRPADRRDDASIADCKLVARVR